MGGGGECVCVSVGGGVLTFTTFCLEGKDLFLMYSLR